jgi:hypothetical protein
MAIIGMDIHRSFAQVALLQDGQIKREQRVDLIHDRFVRFAKTLSIDDEVVIEATGNSAAVERILRPFVKRVVVANPRMVRAIAYARVKTDKIDAAILAKLHAGGFLPEVWVADDNTQRQRRQTAERMGVLEQMVRTKGRIHAILHAHLIPTYSGHLFGKAGKRWLAGLPLPDEEKAIVGRLVDELERNSDQLATRHDDHPRSARRPARGSPHDDPGDRADRRFNGPGLDRRYLAVRDAGETELLLRIDTEGPAVRRPSRASWTNQQTGKHACSTDARRGGVVREDGARPAESVLRTCPAESGRTRSGRRDREKAGGDDLARSDGRDRVRLRAARLYSNEATQSGAQSGRSP